MLSLFIIASGQSLGLAAPWKACASEAPASCACKVAPVAATIFQDPNVKPLQKHGSRTASCGASINMCELPPPANAALYCFYLQTAMPLRGFQCRTHRMLRYSFILST